MRLTPITLLLLLLSSAFAGNSLYLTIGALSGKKHSVPVQFSKPSQITTSIAFVQAMLGQVEPLSPKGIKIPFLLDTSSSEIGIANELVPFGTKCDSSIDCELLDDQKFIYRGSEFEGKAAKALLRFKEEKPAEDVKYEGLEFVSFNPKSSDWKFGENNVLGLGPKSPFWKYFVENFQNIENEDYKEFSINYKSNDSDNQFFPTKSKFEDSEIIINGHGRDADPLLKTSADKNQWVYPKAKMTRWVGDDQQVYNVCVANQENIQFALSPEIYDVVAKKIFKELCSGKEKCTSDNSVIDRVDTMYLSFGEGDKEINVPIRAIDLVYFEEEPKPKKNEDEKDEPMIARLALKKLDGSICPGAGNVQVAVGKLFLAKAEFVVRIDKNGNFLVGFNPVKRTDAKILLLILVIFISLLLAGLTATLFLTVCMFRDRVKGKGDDKGETGEMEKLYKEV